MERTLIIIGLGVLLLEAINVVTLTVLSTQGRELGRIEEQIVTVKERNVILQEEVLKAESLQNIELKARAEGFVPATYLYLK